MQREFVHISVGKMSTHICFGFIIYFHQKSSVLYDRASYWSSVTTGSFYGSDFFVFAVSIPLGLGRVPNGVYLRNGV